MTTDPGRVDLTVAGVAITVALAESPPRIHVISEYSGHDFSILVNGEHVAGPMPEDWLDTPG